MHPPGDPMVPLVPFIYTVSCLPASIIIGYVGHDPTPQCSNKGYPLLPQEVIVYTVVTPVSVYAPASHNKLGCSHSMEDTQTLGGAGRQNVPRKSELTKFLSDMHLHQHFTVGERHTIMANNSQYSFFILHQRLKCSIILFITINGFVIFITA